MESNRIELFRVAIYARYSTRQQSETSIDDQFRVGLEYAQKMEIDESVIDFFYDKATTGQVSSRSGFNELLEKIKLGIYKIIIVYDYSRLFRSDIQGRIFEETCRNENVRILSIKDHIDTFDPGSKIQCRVMSCINSIAPIQASDGANRAHDTLISENLIFWRIYGYQLKRTLDNKPDSEIHTETSVIVEEIFQLYDEGHSIQQITNIFNKKRCRPILRELNGIPV